MIRYPRARTFEKAFKLHELELLLVSPLISLIILHYIILYKTPCKEFGALSSELAQVPGAHWEFLQLQGIGTAKVL